MAWTTGQPDEALVAYERELHRAGRTPGTIATYVGDARRFVAWLAGTQGIHRANSTKGLRQIARIRRVVPFRVIATPRDLAKLVRAWQETGEAPQVAIAWPRDRWMSSFDRHRSMLRSLPDTLDRAAIRAVAAKATDSETATEAAVVATMAWGFGWVGYGPHRTHQMLRSMPDAVARLRRVALAVRNESAVVAYGLLARDCRIKGLGPAFGTKFIAFCQPTGARPTALIHDELVSSWLAVHGRPDLSSVAWSRSTYEAYLEQMHAWADSLGVVPEVIEYLIFQAMADQRGNQWASPR